MGGEGRTDEGRDSRGSGSPYPWLRGKNGRKMRANQQRGHLRRGVGFAMGSVSGWSRWRAFFPLTLVLFSSSLGLVCADFEIGGHLVETAKSSAISPRTGWLPFVASLGQLAAVSIGLLRSDAWHEQWYVEFERGLEPGRIEDIASETGAPLGIHIASNVHLVTGPAKMARKLAGKGGVRWVGARPPHHKVDKHLLDLVSGAEAEPGLEYAHDDPNMLLVKAVVADLIPSDQQNTKQAATAEELARECAEAFKGRATAWPIGTSRVLVSVEDIWGGGLAHVSHWLSNRWEVMRIEAKPTNMPMAKHATKMMTHDVRGQGDQAAWGNIMSSTERTFTVAATARWVPPGDGSYELTVNGLPVLEGDGVVFEIGRVKNMLETVTGSTGHTYYSDTSSNYTTGIVLASNAQLVAKQGSISKMAILVYSDTFGGDGVLKRLVTSYDPATRLASIIPVIPHTITAGMRVEIRPNFYPGDVIRLSINAASWVGEVRPDVLSQFEPASTPRKAWVINCPGGPAGYESMPSWYGWSGYMSRGVTCEASGGRIIATIAVPGENPLWERGLTGAGQIVGVGDTGLDYSNCLLSESPKVNPPFQSVDQARRKVVGYHRTTDCKMCDGCPKRLSWDRFRFSPGTDGQIGTNQLFGRAWPHACNNPQLTVPAGCQRDSSQSQLSPRRYDKYGATLDMDIIATSPPGTEYATEIRVYVLVRDHYDAYVNTWTPSSPAPSSCLNPNCATASRRVQLKMQHLPPSRRGYGIAVVSATAGVIVQMANGLTDYGEGIDAIQFYTASIPCGDQRDSPSGHGTLVSGVIAGSIAPGVGSDVERMHASEYQGIAKDAKLFVNDMSAGSSGSDNITVPLDLSASIFKPAYDAGARIHSNSWSCYYPQITCDGKYCTYTPVNYCNKYSSEARQVDDFMWENPEFLVLVAVGDVIGWKAAPSAGTIRSPGTCKNCISVGSSHLWTQAIQQAVPYMNAMDSVSAPLGGLNHLCPAVLTPPAKDWTDPNTKLRRRREGRTSQMIGGGGDYRRAGSDDSAYGGYDSYFYNDTAPKVIRRQQTPAPTPAPYTGIWTGPQVPYTFVADCCNSTPGYNEMLQSDLDGYTQQYNDAVRFGQLGKAGEIKKTIDLVQAKFYPCSAVPHCCNSVGVENPSCCPTSYAAKIRMPWDPTTVSYATSKRLSAYDSHRMADTCAQGPAGQKKEVLIGQEDTADTGPNTRLRYKPDMVAPGTWVVAANARSDPSGAAHCSMPRRNDLPYDEEAAVVAMSGSSVATAVMAGAAALVRQYFTEGWFPSGKKTPAASINPSAALIKAALILSSGSLTDDADNSPTPNPVPDYKQGFGRPSLLRVLDFADRPSVTRTWYKDEKVGLALQDWVHSYEFLVDPSKGPATITALLTYTDPPGASGSAEPLVNDLDLNVTDGRSIGVVNLQSCPLDPFSQQPVKGCNLPISDRANNVERAVFPVPPWIKCTYIKATTNEYRQCADDGQYGALLKYEYSAEPVKVQIKVRAFRIVKPCVSDGFFKDCKVRKQPYALAVSGPLLTRNGEVIPPVFSSFQGYFRDECVGNITLCAQLEYQQEAKAGNPVLSTGDAALKGTPSALLALMMSCVVSALASLRTF